MTVIAGNQRGLLEVAEGAPMDVECQCWGSTQGTWECREENACACGRMRRVGGGSTRDDESKEHRLRRVQRREAPMGVMRNAEGMCIRKK